MSDKKNKLKILMSGGSGLLGVTLCRLDAEISAPSREEMNVCDITTIEAALDTYQPDIFLHAAAFTSPPLCNESPLLAIETNIVGTANVVKATANKGVRLVYISTDYVFSGSKGNYKEDDELLPQNLYAWSKLGGECALKAHPDHLIIRTSFSPNEFPYDAAFVDQYTSRDSVEVIGKLILKMIDTSIEETILHIGTDRKTVKELALSLGKSDVTDLSRTDVNFATPFDTSLDLSLLEKYNSPS